MKTYQAISLAAPWGTKDTRCHQQSFQLGAIGVKVVGGGFGAGVGDGAGGLSRPGGQPVGTSWHNTYHVPGTT